jgi:hypothetical protein
VGNQLRHLQGILKALFVLSLLYPGVDMELAWWPVECAVDLNGFEVLGIVIKPGSLSYLRVLFGRSRLPNRGKTSRYSPPGSSFYNDVDGRWDIDYPGNTKLYFNREPIIEGVEVDG